VTFNPTLVATGTPQVALNSDDGVVNSVNKFGGYSKTFQAYNIFADFNGHGVVDINDVRLVRSLLGTTFPYEESS
jgi:hypothetical protein